MMEIHVHAQSLHQPPTLFFSSSNHVTKRSTLWYAPLFLPQVKQNKDLLKFGLMMKIKQWAVAREKKLRFFFFFLNRIGSLGDALYIDLLHTG